MQTPSVNAVGLLEVPPDYEAEPRQYRRTTRLLALAFLIFFAAVTVGSTVISLGAYCLTSHGADTRALRSSPLLLDHGPATATATEAGIESSVGAESVK